MPHWPALAFLLLPRISFEAMGAANASGRVTVVVSVMAVTSGKGSIAPGGAIFRVRFESEILRSFTMAEVHGVSWMVVELEW